MARIPGASAGSARRRIMSTDRASSEQVEIQERLLQSIRACEMNRLEPQRPGGRQVLLAVVDEDHPPGLRLRHAEATFEHRARRLAHTEPAGREKGGKKRAQSEVIDPVVVELHGFVV